MCIQKHGQQGQLGCKHYTECACGAPAPQCHGQAQPRGRACVKCLQFFVSDSIPECAQGAVAGSRGTEIGQTWEIQPACLCLPSISHTCSFLLDQAFTPSQVHTSRCGKRGSCSFPSPYLNVIQLQDALQQAACLIPGAGELAEGPRRGIASGCPHHSC